MNEALKVPAKILPLLAIGALFSIALSVRAQDDPPQAGRLSYLTGNVSVQPAGAQDWGEAYSNLPLGPGDRIYTDARSRAEIQVGRTFVRIGPNSDVTLVDASPSQIAFGIGQGAVHVRTDGLWQDQYLSIQTPSGSTTVNQPADFRVDVYPDQQAAVFTANSGADYISGAGGFGVNLNSGQAIELVGSNPVYPQWLEPAPYDALDQWSQSRDQQIARAASYRYVNSEIDGAYDLDEAGDWRPGTEYGDIWFPRVEAGWEPYRNGHWVNRDPWGWVWVEDEPWGYAPFHYGRWVNYQGRWGWIPGPRQEHPVWSPALVVFAGGIGGGGISAWFPLGPGEPYRPSYPCSPRYIDRINRSNIAPAPRVVVQKTYVNITNINVTNITYVNQRNVVAVRQQDFASGRSVAQSSVRIDPRDVQRVQVIARPVVAPPARPIITRPIARPGSVPQARPMLINSEGKTVAAQPHAQPITPPVRPVVAPQPLPGRQVIAPPPNVKMTPTAQRALQNAPARPNAPMQQGPQRPNGQEPQRPSPQQPSQPAAQQQPGRPSPIAPNVQVRPGTPAAQPYPAQPYPAQPNPARPNPAQPRPDQARPGQPAPPPQSDRRQQPDRPQYQPQPRPNQPLPPADRSMPQQPLPPATRPLPNQPRPDQPRLDQQPPNQPRLDQPRPNQPATPPARPLPEAPQQHPVQPPPQQQRTQPEQPRPQPEQPRQSEPQTRPVQPQPVRPPAERPAPPSPRPMPETRPVQPPPQQRPAPETRPAPPPPRNDAHPAPRPAPSEKDKEKEKRPE